MYRDKMYRPQIELQQNVSATEVSTTKCIIHLMYRHKVLKMYRLPNVLALKHYVLVHVSNLSVEFT